MVFKWIVVKFHRFYPMVLVDTINLILMVKVFGLHQKENISGRNLPIETSQWCFI